MGEAELLGEWISKYTYGQDASSEHEVSFEQEGSFLVGLGTNDSGSNLTLRLEYDPKNNVLSGTWHEFTSPSGKYKGEEFHGAVQFILNRKKDSAEGKWIGFNSTREKINTGVWSLTKIKK